MTSLCTYPRMQVIRATDICDGLIVDNFPSLRSSASSWFNVTNSASIATMSPARDQSDMSEIHKLSIMIDILKVKQWNFLITIVFRLPQIQIKSTGLLMHYTCT